MQREAGRRRGVRPRSAGRNVVAPSRRPPIVDLEPQPGEAVQLQLLGPFALRHRSRAIRSLPKKAQALLAYLAMQRGKPVPREQLADLLWGRSGGEHARRSLRQCLMSARAALKASGGDALIADVDTVALAPDSSVDLDVARFERLRASENPDELEAASALYRDEFLTGLQVTSESFAEWVVVERRRLASAMSDLLCKLAGARARTGELEKAIAAAERLTALDPLREDGHRLLMQFLAQAGRRSAAL
jgi:DNA-binding SARP family transcriptional activator